MHSKYQRRYHRADTAVRQVLRNRQTTNSPIDDDDSEPELTGPITITVVQTISVATTSAEASTTSLAQTTASATSIGTLLGLPTQATSSTTSSVEQTSPTSASQITITSSTATSSTSSTTSSISSTTAATATPSNSEALNAESPTSLAPGGVAGIILGCLILAFIALFLLMRALSQHKRQRRRRRSKWVQSRLIDPPVTINTRPNVPPPPPPPFVELVSPTRTETLQTAPTEMTETRERPRLLTVRNATPSIISTITYPTVSYNNVDPSPVSGTTSGAVEQSSGNGLTGFTPYSTPNTALVVCTFICNLPDELAINVGERMRVLAEYDDGWALCMNASGEQGMVPLECLKMSASEGSISMGYSLSELDMRRSRRASSLNPMQQASKF